MGSRGHHLRVCFTALCLGLFGFAMLQVTPARADIVIEGDDWDQFQELMNAPGTPPIAIVETADGRKSLHLTRPSGDKSAIFHINVTRLPAGETRFPVEVVSRQVMDASNGCTIRNLTIDPEPDPGFQNSFVSILVNDGGAGGPALARDERAVQTFDAEGFDPAGTIGASGLQVADPASDTATFPDGVTATVNATLELQMGLNVLRIDPADPRDLPAYQPDCGSQLFSITVGPGVAGLTGTVLPGSCRATRSSSTDRYLPGEAVEITVRAANVSPGTVIVETVPSGWTAVAPGATIQGNTVTFNLDTDGDVTYQITPPANFCEAVSLSGTISNANPAVACDAEVRGSAGLSCIEIPVGATVFDFDAAPGPTTDFEVPDFFDILGTDGLWVIDPNTVNPANDSQALHTTSNGGGLESWFSRVLLLREDIFEAQDVFVSADITWDDDDHAGIYFRFTGASDVPTENNYYFLRLYANNRGVHLHRVKDGVQELLLGDAPQPSPGIVPGTTATVTVRAEGEDIFVFVDGEPIAGMDPFTDDLDPILGCGRVGIGQFSNPSYFDNLTFASLEAGEACPCGASRDLPARTYGAGERLTVTLNARNITGAATLSDTFPAGWTVTGNPDGGTVNGNQISFNLDADAEVSYVLQVPAGFCESVTFTGTLTGAGCVAETAGDAHLQCIGTLGIVIEGDDWENFTSVGREPNGNASVLLPSVVTTDDGRKSLYFSGDPGDDMAFVHYIVNVTRLPGGGPGPERFPIVVEARHSSDGGIVIRNLTVDPIDPALGFQDQASFAGVMIREDPDQIFALGTGEQPFDPCFDTLDRDDGPAIIASLWSTIGQADGNATSPTDVPGGETGIVVTSTVMLDLVQGQNVLRFDTGDLREPPCSTKGESGHQVFTLRIGANEPDLTGEVVQAREDCAAMGDEDGDGLADCDDPDCAGQPPCQARRFIRGNVDDQGTINISDPIFLLSWLFQGGATPTCLESGNVDGQGTINISDPIFLLSWLFQGGPPPPAPFPDCGRPDPDPGDAVDCKTPSICP